MALVVESKGQVEGCLTHPLSNNCKAQCYGLECMLGPDPDLIETRVEPLLGKPFIATGNYIPTWRELLVGRRPRYGVRLYVMRLLRHIRR